MKVFFSSVLKHAFEFDVWFFHVKLSKNQSKLETKKKLQKFSIFFFSGASRLEQGSDDDTVFNDNASVISNVSSGSLMKDEGKIILAWKLL